MTESAIPRLCDQYRPVHHFLNNQNCGGMEIQSDPMLKDVSQNLEVITRVVQNIHLIGSRDKNKLHYINPPLLCPQFKSLESVE